jgi:hypothetical protein
VSYTLKTITDTPYGTYPPFEDGGPAMVQNEDWQTSTSTRKEGARVSAFKVVCHESSQTTRHALDGQNFPTAEDARRAQYEAGLIAYMVYDDSKWADNTDNAQKILDLLRPTWSSPVTDAYAATQTAEHYETNLKAARLNELREFMLWRHELAVIQCNADKERSHAGTLFFIDTGWQPIDHGDEFDEYGLRLRAEALGRFNIKREQRRSVPGGVLHPDGDLEHRSVAPMAETPAPPFIFDVGKPRPKD